MAAYPTMGSEMPMFSNETLAAMLGCQASSCSYPPGLQGAAWPSAYAGSNAMEWGRQSSESVAFTESIDLQALGRQMSEPVSVQTMMDIKALGRQMSEPASVPTSLGMKAKRSLMLPEPAKVRDILFEQAGETMMRSLKMSEPIKLRMTGCGGTEYDADAGHEAVRSSPTDMDDDTPTVSGNSEGSNHSTPRESNCSKGSPHFGPMALESIQEFEPKKVGISMAAPPKRWSPGQCFQQGPTSVIMYNMPAEYTEDLFVEELRDGGFIKGRDFSELMFVHQNGAGFCMLSFVAVGVTRAFEAAFEGRPMRHAFGHFNLIVVPEETGTKETLCPATVASFSRSLGA